MGRKAYEPTPEQRDKVKTLSGFGINQRDIASHLGINHSTLIKYFQKELDEGILVANSKVSGALYKNAINGNVTAQIFWCKTRMGWREVIEHTGADGEPLIPVLNVTIKKQND